MISVRIEEKDANIGRLVKQWLYERCPREHKRDNSGRRENEENYKSNQS